MDFTILVGSMTGTAEALAEDIEAALVERGHSAARLNMDEAGPAVFDDRGARVFLVCSSTYGDGETPDNAVDFHEALGRLDPGALAGVRFGVVSLGDSVYETFARGGLQIGERMESLGAERVGEPCRHDASGGEPPEEVALAWLPGWLEALGA